MQLLRSTWLLGSEAAWWKEQNQARRHLPKAIRTLVQLDRVLPPSLPASKCLCDLEQSPNSQLLSPHQGGHSRRQPQSWLSLHWSHWV